MNLHQLKNELKRDIQQIEDINLLKRIQKITTRSLYPPKEIHTDLSVVNQYDVIGARPFLVQFKEHEFEPKKWVDLYVEVIKWVLDYRKIESLSNPILDYSNKTQCVVNNKPYHLNGKSFRSEFKHKALFIDGHGGTKHHVNTLIKIFTELYIPLEELKIGFWLPQSPSNTISGSI
ncbi:MAG: hypothetical protein ACI9Z3_001012 [Roseivirga sp.]|jgi:hypothetical protein